MNKRFFSRYLPTLAMTLALVGCQEGYSESMRYAVRTDPIMVAKLGDEPTYPDQPGQLPILAVSDFLDIRNPYYKETKKLEEKGTNLIKSQIFRDPTKLTSDAYKVLAYELKRLYGTPAHPRVEMNDGQREALGLADETLARGSQLYRIHCLHCHGVTGDGRGPTARWVNPHPRDYRQGHFKFQSVNQVGGQIPPHRDDLLRILDIGIEGTAMPSFIILPQEQREALASYVIHLSIRGKTEFDTLRFGMKLNEETMMLEPNDAENFSSNIQEFHQANVAAWVDSQDKRIKVPEYPAEFKDPKNLLESAKKGQAYFLGTDPEIQKVIGKNACVTCHKDYGRQSTFRFDEWGTLAKPNNLTQGIYRGGRRPIDIYYRIHSGILPSGMIAFGGVLKEEQIWHLVNFVQVVGSNPTMRKAAGIVLD